MGRKNVWETPLGQELEAKLLRGEIKQKDAAKQLGISSAAVSKHMKYIQSQMDKIRVKMEDIDYTRKVVKEKADKAINEVEIIKRNIDKLLEWEKRAEKYMNLSPAWFNTVLKVAKELREHCETLLRLTGELMPETQITIQFTKYEQHINILNTFIFELAEKLKKPEIIDWYEQFLREKLAELKPTTQ